MTSLKLNVFLSLKIVIFPNLLFLNFIVINLSHVHSLKKPINIISMNLFFSFFCTVLFHFLFTYKLFNGINKYRVR